MGAEQSTLKKNGYVLQRTTQNAVVAAKGDETFLIKKVSLEFLTYCQIVLKVNKINTHFFLTLAYMFCSSVRDAPCTYCFFLLLFGWIIMAWFVKVIFNLLCWVILMWVFFLTDIWKCWSSISLRDRNLQDHKPSSYCEWQELF